MAYSGIDYGMGQANIDSETGIRCGVLSGHALASHAWDTIQSEATDLDYAEAVENVKSELAHAIKSVLEEYSASFDAKELASDIVDDLDFDLESGGDSRRYLYEGESETFNVLSDGDLMVTKSKYYTLCAFCSPCVPGAGYLSSDGSVKTYCLGPDWFSDESPMPYVCFRVSDDTPMDWATLQTVKGTSGQRATWAYNVEVNRSPPMAYHVARVSDEGQTVRILESCTTEDAANEACDHFCDLYPFAYIDVFSDKELADLQDWANT